MEHADLAPVDLDQTRLALAEFGERADVNGVACGMRHVIPTLAVGF
jgi:hypothetical protein